MAVFFNGHLWITPAVMSRIDDTAMANKNLAVPMNLAVIGQADSGEPKKVWKFGNPVEAREVLQGGELLTAVEKAFAPSSETYGPEYVYAVRVDPATSAHLAVPQNGASAVTGACQAALAQTLTLAAGASATNDYYNGYMVLMTSGTAIGETNLVTDYAGDTKIATLRYPWKNVPTAADTYSLKLAAFCVDSVDYGNNANRLRMKVAAGTVSGLKLTTAFANSSIVSGDLLATYFTLGYSGADASCVAEITGTEIKIKSGVLAAEVLKYTCAFATYDTVAKVVDFLDSKADLAAVYTPQYRDKPTAYAFDFQASLAIGKTNKSPTPDEVTSITANLQAVLDWIDGQGEPYITSYRPTQSGVIPATFDWTYLTGGGSTSPVTQDWQDCFDLIQVEDVQCVVPLSSSASVHAMSQAHVEFMSDNGRMERRTIVGGALNETIAEVVQRAYDLNADRVYLVAPGYKDYDMSGVLVTYAPYMLAAILGGMICGTDPGTSLTNKTITIRGLEQKFRNPTDTDDLITAGAIPVCATKQGYKVIRSVSTWLANENYNRVEMATGFATDYVARSVRLALEPLIGSKGTPRVLIEAVSRTENCLKELERPSPMGPEVITGDDANPAYKNITASLEGDVLRVSFQCSPVVPINYIPVSIYIVPYSGTYSSATSST